LVVSASGRGHRTCEDDLFLGYNIDIASDEGCAIAAIGRNAGHHMMLENYDGRLSVVRCYEEQQRSA